MDHTVNLPSDFFHYFFNISKQTVGKSYMSKLLHSFSTYTRIVKLSTLEISKCEIKLLSTKSKKCGQRNFATVNFHFPILIFDEFSTYSN